MEVVHEDEAAELEGEERLQIALSPFRTNASRGIPKAVLNLVHIAISLCL